MLENREIEIFRNFATFHFVNIKFAIYVSCWKKIQSVFTFLSVPRAALIVQAGPDGSFVSTGACDLQVPGSNRVWAGYLLSLLCIYSAPNCSKEWSVQCCL